MNSYFASVEQQFDAKLRGNPLGVCAYLSRNGCIIASSIEAKQWGVKTGMRVGEAKRLCPILNLVENHPKKYRATTEKIFNILKDYSDDFEPYSIDEAFLKIPYVHTEEEGFELGREWNTRIKKEVGEVLRSSVGFAANRFYAKVFSDTGPKDSVTHVAYPQLDNYLASLGLEDIWGIGRQTARRLRTLKVFTPSDLKNSPPEPIIEEFGIYGYELWKNLNLVTHNSYLVTQKDDFQDLSNQLRVTSYGSRDYPKSVGHSYCLPIKTYNLEFYKKILYKLCERTCIRLREMKKVAGGVAFYFSPRDHYHRHPELDSARLAESRQGSRKEKQTEKDLNSFGVSFGFLDSSFRWNDNGGKKDVTKIKSHGSFKLSSSISDALDMYHEILPYLERLPRQPLYMIAVSLFSLSSNERKQLSLFDARRGEACLASTNHKEDMLRSFDAINRKWGPFTVQRGLMWNTEQYALERIGFRKL